jgi:hypothetical protein
MAYEFSFVQPTDDADYALPVKEWGDLAFYCANDTISVQLRDTNDVQIESNKSPTYIAAGSGFICFPSFYSPVPPCFEIFANSIVGYFYRDDGKNSSVLIYQCNEDEFGFNYRNNLHINKVRLPIRITKPKWKQADEIYTKFSGSRVMLSSTIDKQWTLETDYMPASFHERLAVALSHDNVWIDGKLLTRDDAYDVDWGDTMYRNGVACARATCKMVENVTRRNSNIGGALTTEETLIVSPTTINF